MEHEFVNANMSRAALSAESLLLRLINARAAHKSRSAMFEASVERQSECEKAFNCRAFLNRCVEIAIQMQGPRCWHVLCNTPPAHSTAVL